MPPETTAQRTARSRRARAHSCPECHSSWAIRGSRHPSGAWLLLCRVCGWRRVVTPSVVPGPHAERELLGASAAP